MYRTILYPTDLSACADAARPLALAFAGEGTALHLLYADTYLWRASDEARVREALADLGRRIEAEAPAAVHTAVAQGVAAAEVILGYAEAHGVDLIVLGTHGRRGAARLLIGSTAREVVQLAPCPVLTVREGGPAPALRGGGVLVAIDFSEPSREALRQAARLARAFGARLDLLHVMEDLYHPAGYGYTLRSVAEVDPGAEARLGEALRVFRDEVAVEAAREGRLDVLPGPPARAIAAAAERLGSALVVMGTRGLGGVARLTMGSVAEAVLREAPCPVLTVKASEDAQAAHDDLARAAEGPPLRARPLRSF